MAFRPALPKKFAKQWAVKIRDRERVEPPHVTFLRKSQAWRLDLRSETFLDRVPPPREVPPALLKFVRSQLPRLVAEWNAMYPENLVESDDE